jgi:alanine dehydrogenase
MHGHQVFVEASAGAAISHPDREYEEAGATILATAEEVFEVAQMIVKVKEPQTAERKLLKPEQLLFTYLHLAPDYDQTAELVRSGSICIAYETVTDERGHLPLLAPMSEVAGRMSIQAGAMCLEKSHGGSGVLLGGVPGVAQARVVILGGGVVGSNAAQMAIGMGANVTVIDRSLQVLSKLDQHYGNRIQTLFSTHDTIEKEVLQADLVVGGVLVPGDSAPKLVGAEMVRSMKAGAAVVDVSIDQGGCFETSRATTHADPIYVVDDVVHYCVANMPGAVARTSTVALNNATLPYVLELADKGIDRTLQTNCHLLQGLSVCKGYVTSRSVSDIHHLEYLPPKVALAA